MTPTWLWCPVLRCEYAAWCPLVLSHSDYMLKMSQVLWTVWSDVPAQKYCAWLPLLHLPAHTESHCTVWGTAALYRRYRTAQHMCTLYDTTSSSALAETLETSHQTNYYCWGKLRRLLTRPDVLSPTHLTSDHTSHSGRASCVFSWCTNIGEVSAGSKVTPTTKYYIWRKYLSSDIITQHCNIIVFSSSAVRLIILFLRITAYNDTICYISQGDKNRTGKINFFLVKIYQRDISALAVITLSFTSLKYLCW